MKKNCMASYTKKNIANFEAFLKSIKLDANFFIQFSYTDTYQEPLGFFLYLRVDQLVSYLPTKLNILDNHLFLSKKFQSDDIVIYVY